MVRHSVRERTFAICLAALAGFVDALAFLELGGYFVSFMSGNTTRLGAGLASGSTFALLPLGLVALFVFGVFLGSFAGRRPGSHRQTRVLAFVTFMLAAAALAEFLGSTPAAIIAMSIAMGAENAVFERDGEVSIGVTYMTGTLVKLGQRLMTAMTGGDRLAWVWYLVLWMGLAAGAVCGAWAYSVFGLSALAGAAAFSALLAVILALMNGRSSD